MKKLFRFIHLPSYSRLWCINWTMNEKLNKKYVDFVECVLYDEIYAYIVDAENYFSLRGFKEGDYPPIEPVVITAESCLFDGQALRYFNSFEFGSYSHLNWPLGLCLNEKYESEDNAGELMKEIKEFDLNDIHLSLIECDVDPVYYDEQKIVNNLKKVVSSLKAHKGVIDIGFDTIMKTKRELGRTFSRRALDLEAL